jgi:dipeptidyl aminopeptidase/acylaminoacyl peptidase
MKSAVLHDWNLQLGKNADLNKACDNEYARAQRLLKRLQEANKLGDFKERLAKAQELKSGKDKYEALRKIKRDMMFALLSFDKILYVDSPFPVGMEASHESRVKTENTASYDAYLRTLDLSTSDYSEKTLVGGENSAITRATLNYDADKIVFSMRDKKDPSYNLYKINADGSKLEKLTSSHYNDMDPAWLPDGNIVFVSTRSNHYIRCAGSGFRGTTLARCDADGKNIYFISTNNEADFMPSVLDDGRIIYCRWEYVDKNIFRVQDFWTVNPDGTNPQIY